MFSHQAWSCRSPLHPLFLQCKNRKVKKPGNSHRIRKVNDSYLITTRQITNVHKITFCQSVNCYFNAAKVPLADIPLDLVKPNSVTQAEISENQILVLWIDHRACYYRCQFSSYFILHLSDLRRDHEAEADLCSPLRLPEPETGFRTATSDTESL